MANTTETTATLESIGTESFYSLSDSDGNEYSTNAGDYWDAPDSQSFPDCELWQKVTAIVTLNGQKVFLRGWTLANDAPTVGDLRKLSGGN